jgi:hypothetical protein
VHGLLLDERLVHNMKTDSGASLQQLNDEEVTSGLENIWNGQPLTDAIKRPKTWACQP